MEENMYKDLTEQEAAEIEEIRKELRVLPNIKGAVLRREFYLSIIDMIGEEVPKSKRMKGILTMLIDGKDIRSIADEYGLTRERIRQLVVVTIRKAARLINYQKIKEENEALKKENIALKITVKEYMDYLRPEMPNELLGKTDEEIDEIYNILMTPIDDTDLSIRTKNALYKFRNIGDAARFSRIDLLKIRNFGAKSIDEFEGYLRRHGLNVGCNTSAIIRYHVTREFSIFN